MGSPGAAAMVFTEPNATSQTNTGLARVMGTSGEGRYDRLSVLDMEAAGS